MAKQMYRIIDSRGRVYLPKELRLSLDLEAGSFVKLTEDEGNLRLRKVHLIELGDHSPETVGKYVSAAAAAMPREKQLRLAARLLERLNEKKEATECIFAKAEYQGQMERLQAQLEELIQRRDSHSEAMTPDNKWIRLMKEVRYANKLNQELVNAVIEKILIYEGGKFEIFFKYHDIFILSKQYIEFLTEGSEIA